MDRAKIFQSVIKGTNVFTPIIDSYHTVGNHIIELSSIKLDKLCYSRKEAMEYIKSLGDKENEV